MPEPLLLHGSALHLPLADKSIHCVVTSPPYFGLRAYEGVEPSCWPGGAYVPVPGAAPLVIPGPTVAEMASCARVWTETIRGHKRGHAGDKSTLVGTQTALLSKEAISTSQTCRVCGACHITLGNEPTPSLYLFHLLLCLREMRRVLRDDGVLWLVIADSFFGDSPIRNKSAEAFSPTWDMQQTASRGGMRRSVARQGAYQPGSLVGIPAQFQLAAMADGWVVRNRATWVKASPMPEPCKGNRWEQKRCGCVNRDLTPAYPSQRYATMTDRNTPMGHAHGDIRNRPWGTPDPACPQCHGTGRLPDVVLRRGAWRMTQATEAIFQLTKSMHYWANSEAVKESALALENRGGFLKAQSLVTHKGAKNDGFGDRFQPTGSRNPRNYFLDTPTSATQLAALVQWLAQEAPDVLAAYEAAQQNPSNVLQPAASALELPHYAAFPPALLERLIKATGPTQCCAVCGAGWAPFITAHISSTRQTGDTWQNGRRSTSHHVPSRAGDFSDALSTIHGTRPTCTCATSLPPVPGTVLDPFAGAGTTLLVARALGLRSIGVDASATYTQLARQRLGLEDLAAWEHGTVTQHEQFNDLPLFMCDTPRK